MAAHFRSDRVKSIKLVLKRRQGFKCACCSVSFSNDSRSPDYPTIEHLVPKSLGGTNARENLVLTCWECNYRRGTIPWSKFLELPRGPDNRPYLQTGVTGGRVCKISKRELKDGLKGTSSLQVVTG